MIKHVAHGQTTGQILPFVFRLCKELAQLKERKLRILRSLVGQTGTVYCNIAVDEAACIVQTYRRLKVIAVRAVQL